MNKLLVVANWKANVVDINSWTKEFVFHSSRLNEGRVETVIAAPFTLLQTGYSTLNGEPGVTENPLTLASQDLSMYPPGAFTGEVPAKMLTSLGIKYALLGHSERRKYLEETTVMVGKKLEAAIFADIIPIICAQTPQDIPDNIRNFDSSKYLIMYEPATAISTEGNYHPDSIENIQKTLTEWQFKLPSGIRFLYGGSVSPENIANFQTLLFSGLLTGFVVGHASLGPKSFGDIINSLCSLPA